MFGELVGSKGYSGGHDKDWMVPLEENNDEIWHEVVRRVAKGCTEGQQVWF